MYVKIRRWKSEMGEERAEKVGRLVVVVVVVDGLPICVVGLRTV